MEICELAAHEILERFKDSRICPSDVARSCLRQAEAVDNKIKAFIRLDKAKILSRAGELEKNRPAGSLAGLPVTIKDNICVKDELTTCASRILEGFIPPYNATVVERLEKEGAFVFGRANMDEFAFGSSTETSHFSPTRNPWDLSKVPGGSSGGSAAAVASFQTILALGSDTGGSIRQPAALCGVVGLKPTYGRVSRYGLIAFASSLDQIGPLTRDVEDCARVLNVIAGWDERDSTSADVPVPDYAGHLRKEVKDLTIGVPKEYFIEGIDEQVGKSVREAIEFFRDFGAEVKDISLPHTEYAVSVYYIIATSEASSNLARFDGVQYGYRKGENVLLEMYKKTRGEGFGSEAKRRIILGTFALSSGYYDAYYLKAQKVRTLLKEDFDRAFTECDIILTPTSPTPAFGLGEKIKNPLSMYLADIFTIPANLAGIPGISIPCGFTGDGLPMGLQILGKPFDEETIIRAAFTFEQNTDYHKRKPEWITRPLSV